tara:strand:+ start:240 stop:527 length:288 start_codon:yes stop_codon:yes gene_type:complete
MMVTGMAISADARCIYSAWSNGSVVLWDAVSFERVISIDGAHTSPISHMTLGEEGPQGSVLWTCGYDKIWKRVVELRSRQRENQTSMDIQIEIEI